MTTPVTTHDMKELLEEFAKMFRAKSEADASSTREIVQRPEMVQRLELMPNDVKLEGAKNYLSWSRRASLILRTKGLEHYVRETCVEPADKGSVEWRTWCATNSLVVAWMMSSMSPTIVGMVEAICNAADMWTMLAKMYSGAGNVMLMVEVQTKIDNLKQGEKSVLEYAAELQHLWSDLDHYDPLACPDTTSAALSKRWIERRRVTFFLKGLNAEFEHRRATMDCRLRSI